MVSTWNWIVLTRVVLIGLPVWKKEWDLERKKEYLMEQCIVDQRNQTGRKKWLSYVKLDEIHGTFETYDGVEDR